MPEYDFHQLSPLDLEHLARDLLQAEWSVRMESFKSGRDGGVDLRHASGPDKLVVQVKHYVRTGLAGLISDLKKENSKVKKLAPSRYAVVTSVPLSPQDKDKIVAALPSAPLVADDVFGQEDLNNLLGRHPEVEQRHPKLWLTSRAVLDKVIHNAEVTRSEFEVRKIHQQIRRYVQTDAFREAEERLTEESVVMIAGPPGIGKTTLANMLLYEHLSQEWQAVVIDRDVSEGAKLFQQGTNQIFYFDDFVGATLVGEGISGKDKALLNFIAMIRDDPTSRLILTTREHLYEQAVTRSERLRHAGLDADRVILRMQRYSLRERAQILYNHIYFSDLPSAHIDALLEGDFYRSIIRHKKFNPRVIEWMASRQRTRHVEAQDYCAFIDRLLDNPLEIWRHAYEQELSDAARSLLLVLWSFEGRIALSILGKGFNKAHAIRSEKYGFIRTPQDFNRALKELSGSFVTPWGRDAVEVVDSSVLDLLGLVLREDPENAIDLLLGSGSFSQVERLWKAATQDKAASIRKILRDSGSIAAPIIKNLMLQQRRKDYPDGSKSWHGPTYESRLAVAAAMAEAIKSNEYEAIVDPIASKVISEPSDDGVDINALVDLVISIEVNDSSKYDGLAEKLRERVFQAVSIGCRSDELREAMRLLDETPNKNELGALEKGYEAYCEHYYFEERSNCRSRDEFEGLIADLTEIQETLNVNTEDKVAEVEEARLDFEESEDQYADAHADEYKEQWRAERRENESIADMFESLKSDRGG